jgi:hypothetical protein
MEEKSSKMAIDLYNIASALDALTQNEKLYNIMNFAKFECSHLDNP